jgi:hypothetical protein
MGVGMTLRTLELILTANGGAEVVDLDEEKQLWASDSDDHFREEFPDFLDENDLEHVFDYLVEHDVLSEEEADEAEVSMESLKEGNGDEDDDDDDDEEAQSFLEGGAPP